MTGTRVRMDAARMPLATAGRRLISALTETYWFGIPRRLDGPARQDVTTGSIAFSAAGFDTICWKKSFPLSSTRMNAGKSTTSIL